MIRPESWSWRFFLGRVGVLLLAVIGVEMVIGLASGFADLMNSDEYGYCTEPASAGSSPFECDEEVSAWVIWASPVAILFASAIGGAFTRSTRPLRAGTWALSAPLLLGLATYLNGSSIVAFIAILVVPLLLGGAALSWRRLRREQQKEVEET